MVESDVLTPRQREVLDFILKYKKEKGYSPSIREIGKGVGLSSPATVHRHVQVLKEKGFLKVEPSKSRSIEIKLGGREKEKQEKDLVSSTVKKESKSVNYDIFLYKIVKGYDSKNKVFQVEGKIPLPLSVTGRRDAFLYCMENDSMKEDGILKGDLCIVHPQNELEEGCVHLLVSSDQITIKRVFRRFGAYCLEPANRKMNPVYVKDIHILGKVVGLVRKASS